MNEPNERIKPTQKSARLVPRNAQRFSWRAFSVGLFITLCLSMESLLHTVVFDESGNTGADLVRSEQPTFVLSSCDFTKEESKALLELVATHQVKEPKVSRMKKSAPGRRRIVEFISAE